MEAGLRGLGLDPSKTVIVNRRSYSYRDLFTERPVLVRGSSVQEVGLLLDIFDGLGATTKTSEGDSYYGDRAKAAQQTIAQFRNIVDAQGMDECTWAHLEEIVLEFATKTDEQKAAFKELFYSTFYNNCNAIVDSELSIIAGGASENT